MVKGTEIQQENGCQIKIVNSYTAAINKLLGFDELQAIIKTLPFKLHKTQLPTKSCLTASNLLITLIAARKIN